MLTTEEVKLAVANLNQPGWDSEDRDYENSVYEEAVKTLESEWVEWLRYTYSDSLSTESARVVFDAAYAQEKENGWEAIEVAYSALATVVDAVMRVEAHNSLNYGW